MRLSLLLILGTAFLALGALPAVAQTGLSRQEELARVLDLVNDPNPQQRIENFERLVSEGDAIKLQIAIGSAISSDDAVLRGLAFRAYLASTPRIMLEMRLTPEMQKTVDAATARGELETLTRKVAQLERLIDTGMRMQLTIDNVDLRRGSGKVTASIARAPGDLQLTGQRASFRVYASAFANRYCNIDLAPGKSLTIEGTMVCENTGFGKVSLSAPLY